MPVRDNAIYRLAAGLSRIGGYDFPVQLSDITRTYFERSAPAQLDAQTRQDMAAIAKQPTDLAAAGRLAAQSPYFNSIMRTTCVATKLEGGHALNALPQLAAANVNCRILPGVSPVEVLATLKKVIADPAIELSLDGEATPSKPAVLRDDVMKTVETIVGAMFPGVAVVPVMSTGATDGLFLRNAGIPTFGVDGLFDDIDVVRANGRDERVGIKQFNEDWEFQYRLITTLAK
jgi:acetylornithine deacetylase/succinyl-diaminopimelate desuccinylase-like protein